MTEPPVLLWREETSLCQGSGLLPAWLPSAPCVPGQHSSPCFPTCSVPETDRRVGAVRRSLSPCVSCPFQVPLGTVLQSSPRAWVMESSSVPWAVSLPFECLA